MSEEQPAESFATWAILELMGHRRLAGYVTEVQIAGSGMLRLDVPGEEGETATQFYAMSAVYCITPTSESMARSVAKANRPAPVAAWELPRGDDDDGDDVEHDEDEDG